MLKYIYIIVVFCFILVHNNSFGQIKINTNSGTGNMNGNSAFLDASSAPSWKSTTNIGKGMIFPNVDLTTLMTLVQGGGTSGTNNPNRFDGMLVYNTATGTSGIGNVAVKPGFFYYSNATTNLNGGTWVSVGGTATTALGVVVTAVAYTVLDSDSTILCDAASAGFTLTLPSAAGNSGKIYVIRKTDATDNVITFSPSLVYAKGVTVASLNYIKTVRVQSDGTNWNIID
jgi:hypothetical protein